MLFDYCLSIIRRPVAYIAIALLTVFQLSQISGVQAQGESPKDDSWSLIVVPDIQHYVDKEKNMDDFITQMTWIVDNVASLRAAFLTQLGDVVQHGDKEVEWDRAEEGLDLLRGVIPYSITIGDHDYKKEEVRDSGTKEFVRRFGASRYQGEPWYGGASPNECSHFQIFSAGGRQFLHLNLEWEVPGEVDDGDSAMGWARSILDAHPHLPTIISTHSHITDSKSKRGRTKTVKEHNGDGNSGETVWEELIENSPQVFMVLSGNFHAGKRQFDPTDPSADPSDPSDDGEFHQVSTNEAGMPVYEMLSDYQDYPNGGDGWIRIVEFQPGEGEDGLDRISVRTYSTTHDVHQTDELSQFHFDLSFAERFDDLAGSSKRPKK